MEHPCKSLWLTCGGIGWFKTLRQLADGFYCNCCAPCRQFYLFPKVDCRASTHQNSSCFVEAMEMEGQQVQNVWTWGDWTQGCWEHKWTLGTSLSTSPSSLSLCVFTSNFIPMSTSEKPTWMPTLATTSPHFVAHNLASDLLKKHKSSYDQGDLEKMQL